MVRVFAMGRRIDPSWGGPIELFFVPASAPRLSVFVCVCVCMSMFVVCCLCTICICVSMFICMCIFARVSVHVCVSIYESCLWDGAYKRTLAVNR